MSQASKQEWTVILRKGDLFQTVKIKAADEVEAMRKARAQVGEDYQVEHLYVADWKS